MRYSAEHDAVLLSVRELCALAFRTGDLDLRSSGRAGIGRLALGREVHQLLESRAGEGAEIEVALSDTTEFRGLHYQVTGRADIITEGEILTVEEIKSVGARAFEKAPPEIDRAQAMCYAYFLIRARGAESIRVRLTLCRTDNGEVRSVEEICSAQTAERYYRNLLARVAYRAEILAERGRLLLPSVGTGRFPYRSIREAQDIMLKECYRDIKKGKRLFIQAPTGTGKTVSALYPAVRALGEGACDKIFYLTAKTSTAREAYRAAGDIFNAGSRLRTVALTSREELCRNSAAREDPAGISCHCNPADCPYAKGFYDRVGGAVCDLLSRQSGFPRKVFTEAAEQYRLCPYELQLELSEFCDIVICDYNYAFDPSVYLRRYFEEDGQREGQKYVFLIDEAHNLGDRAAAMYSAELSRSRAERLWELLSVFDPDHAEAFRPLESLISAMRGFRVLCRDDLTRDGNGTEHGFYLCREAMGNFLSTVEECRAALEKWAFLHPDVAFRAELTALIASLRRYLTVAEFYDARFLTFLEIHGEESVARLICLDPSRVLDRAMKKAYASVLFSATMTPLDYFAGILGGGKGAVKVSLPSPFDPSHLCVAAVTGVSTRYEDREKSIRRLVGVIAGTVCAKSGNYMVYFPSYDYMEKVHKAFRERYPDVETVVQERGMNAERKEKFLGAFAEDRRLRVGFCVLGGSFSEGVDLPGKRLIGAIVVGVGLPGLSNERNILRDYYETTGENGFDYAYTYPGMNRVLQAAGRVIRREDDRGIIVLADDRYAEPRYRMLFPDQWKQIQYAGNASELANIAKTFWLETGQK